MAIFSFFPPGNILRWGRKKDRNMDDDIIEFVRMNVSVQSLRITESGTADGDASGQQGVAIFFNILLFYNKFFKIRFL